MTKSTPLLMPWNEARAKYPDAVVLIRVGEFYELLGRDVRSSSLSKPSSNRASETER
jgi:DNA mismatch repair ATPase MutS